MDLNNTLNQLINFNEESCNAILILRNLMKLGITGKELAILLTLTINKARHTTSEELGLTIWGESPENNKKLYSAIVVTMKYLKDKLHTTNYEIVAKRNLGYILQKKEDNLGE